jgi:hypothetical protein
MSQSLLDLAKKGRHGDSEMAMVGGKLSHVNPKEKEWIREKGLLGELMTRQHGSGTINPYTGHPEYFFKKVAKWAKKRVTPPKKVREILRRGGDPWEAGKALWDANTGSGVWRPSQGKWGIFGQTDKSKAADKAKAAAKARKATFEDYMRDYGSSNLAALQTENPDDDTPDGYGGATSLKDFVKNAFGSSYSAQAEKDYDRYITKYDQRKETEAWDDLARAQESQNIQAQGTGAQLSSGLFGLMTQSANQSAGQNFAGAGNFEQDFKYKQALESAEREFGTQDINREQTIADTSSGVTDLQEDYTKQFWEDMQTWSNAINA